MLHGLGARTGIENGIPRPGIIITVIHIQNPQKKFDSFCLFTLQLFYNPVSHCKIMEHQITVGRLWKSAVQIVLGKTRE
jgi:hypothetical protein